MFAMLIKPLPAYLDMPVLQLDNTAVLDAVPRAPFSRCAAHAVLALARTTR